MRHWAEESARNFLVSLGYELLAENYTLPGGEIDLVMRDGEQTVFVEVKQRRGRGYGAPGEMVDRRKLSRLRRTATLYLLKTFGRDDLPARFDAVLVEGERDRHQLEHLMGIG